LIHTDGNVEINFLNVYKFHKALTLTIGY
jgi:hypothetical protein